MPIVVKDDLAVSILRSVIKSKDLSTVKSLLNSGFGPFVQAAMPHAETFGTREILILMRQAAAAENTFSVSLRKPHPAP